MGFTWPQTVRVVTSMLVGACICFGSYLRLVDFGENDPANDEGVIAAVVSAATVSEVTEMGRYHSPPPFHLIAHSTFNRLIGAGTFAEIRYFSLILGFVTLIVSFIMARSLFGAQAATVIVAFMSLSPLLIEWSRVGRMYGHTALYSAMFTLAYIGINSKPERKIWFAVFFLCAFLIPATCLPASVLVVALVGHYFVTDNPFRTRVITGAAAGTILLSAWLPSLYLKWGFITNQATGEIGYLRHHYFAARAPRRELFFKESCFVWDRAWVFVPCDWMCIVYLSPSDTAPIQCIQ